MGVTGLWTVVRPCARPIKVETLNRKRLAVDASIWIYQFLKAVRDKEGNALRNSHVVGFFRRICKLLFIGIKPVFVFDGGAPALKRQTINARKRRREGRREDAVTTAGKLFALQMQKRAEEEEQRRKEEEAKGPDVHHGPSEEEPVPEMLVYAEEVHMAPKERQQGRSFKKRDAYHLPDLDVSLAEMGQPDDPRVMSLEELQQYARQFDTGEDINLYDFSKIDFDSPFFTSLPASDRYNILNAARLRSRLRMGYSKDQLDSMFPDRMAFSKFQIDRVKERNELTQRLMTINGMNEDSMFGVNGASRIASEKNREYVLVKNDGVEGGWALGVVTGDRDVGKPNKPIDVDELGKPLWFEEEDEWEEDDFEDIPIEGLNRLPKPRKPHRTAFSDVIARDLGRRQNLYKARKQNAQPSTKASEYEQEDHDSLFVADSLEQKNTLDETGERARTDEDSSNSENANEESDLQRAIAMSLKQGSEQEFDDDEYTEVFLHGRTEESNPFAGGGDVKTARVANARSKKSTCAGPFAEESDDDNFTSPSMKSKSPKYLEKIERGTQLPTQQQPLSLESQPLIAARGHSGLFDGPLPFEKLNLGVSLLGRKKMKDLSCATSGGFEKEPGKPMQKLGTPLPPWFSGAVGERLEAERASEMEDRRVQKIDAASEFVSYSKLRDYANAETVDVDALEEKGSEKEVLIIEDGDLNSRPWSRHAKQNEAAKKGPEPRMNGLAGSIQIPNSLAETYETDGQRENITTEANPDYERFRTACERLDDGQHPPLEQNGKDKGQVTTLQAADSPALHVSQPTEGAGGGFVFLEESPECKDVEFEDIPIEQERETPQHRLSMPPSDQAIPLAVSPPNPTMSADYHQTPIDNKAGAGAHDYSDPEDEQLFRQLAQEQEEHARFAAKLNKRSVQENSKEYEEEVRQLRNQQKKDRRDADEVTQTMVQECQQLLTLFGLPYITAPMEAEAQCAELVRLGLVDGIVTDDSDCFLFGGTRVYKNVFNQAKFVECYLASDLEAEFGLNRRRLIAIAQLLGSDYTEGLPGIGPVTAIEILSEFDSLAAFKSWWEVVQTTGQTKSATHANSKFKSKFPKSHATKLFLSPNFPDPRVEMAYLEPEVDNDPSEFVWGVPDLDALRVFLMTTIGWSAERTDEILVPVIRDMNQRQQEGTQSNITRFFEGSIGAGAFAPGRRAADGSKRLELALQRIGARTSGKPDDGTDAQASEGEGFKQTESPVKKRVSETVAHNGRKKRARKESKGGKERGPEG